jgi:hypothetical protein
VWQKGGCWSKAYGGFLVVGDLIPAAPPWTSDGPASRADARHARRPRGQHQHGPCRGVPAFLPSAIVAQLNDPTRVRCLGRKHHRSRGAGYRWMATGRNQPRPVCGRQRLPQSLARSGRSVGPVARVFTHATQPLGFEVADAASLPNVATKRDEIASTLGPVLPQYPPPYAGKRAPSVP